MRDKRKRNKHLKTILTMWSTTCVRRFHVTSHATRPPPRKPQLKALVCDLGGTTVDKYGLSVLVAYQRAFQRYKNILVPKRIIRENMGTKKDLHIRAILQHPEVGANFLRKQGFPPDEKDVEAVYQLYTKYQLEVVSEFCHPIPGVVSALDRARNVFDVKIFATTGFPRAVADAVVEHCRSQGLWFDGMVASDDLGDDRGARHLPYMMYKLLSDHEIHPRESVLKLDDTLVGIQEGHAAGAWTAGVCRYSNGMAIDSQNHEEELTHEQLTGRVDALKQSFEDHAHAHYVLGTFCELEYVCADINRRLARGETPSAS